MIRMYLKAPQPKCFLFIVHLMNTEEGLDFTALKCRNFVIRINKEHILLLGT